MNTSFNAGGSGAPGVKEGFCPLVITQILKLRDDGIKLFGTTFGVMYLVAILRSIEPSSTKIMYKLEDHTGRIDAHLLLDESKTETIEPIKLNTYVRAYGIPKTIDGVKVIMLFNIRPIKSANEITTHLLEMMNTRYTCERNLKRSRMYDNYIAEKASRSETTRFIKNVLMVCSDRLLLDGNVLNIYEAIKGHKSDEGISIQQIHQNLKHISIQEIRDITDIMCRDGLIYCTINIDHFLAVDVD